MLGVNRNLRHERSSLEVNLSWISNSTDSDDKPTMCNKNNPVSHNRHLRNRSKVLENADRNNDNENQNCKILKVINLTKTNEIFDKQDEISLEKRRIVNGKKNCSSKAINNNIKCADIQNTLFSSMPNFTNKSEGNNGIDTLCQSISGSLKKKFKKIYAHNPKEPERYIEKSFYKLCQQLNGTQAATDDTTLKCHDLVQDLLELNDRNGISDHGFQKLSQTVQTERFSSHNVLKNKCTPIFVEQTLQEIRGNVYEDSSQRFRRKLSGESTSIIDSINTEQFSLNVNTSVHVPIESNNCISKLKQKNCYEEKYKILENKQNDMYSIVSEGMEESINTICSSLQMNTSLGTCNRVQHEETNTFNSFNTEGNDYVDANTKSSKLQPSASIVLDEMHYNSCSTTIHDMTIHSHTLSEELHNTSQSASTGESIDKNESDRNKSKKCVIEYSDKPKRKKKLLPLQECSQLLSFSPIQEECIHPQSNIFNKKRIKKRNKYYKKESNVNILQCNEIKENRDIFEKKQVRKPRKILSKKIIVKKIDNGDILKKLGINKEDAKTDVGVCTLKRGSSNDFQPLKMPLVLQIPRKQPENINIVVTGLSNEDKHLVKITVNALGCAKMGSNVTKHTTHVVTMGVRTINLLHGIIHGCWLVSLDWILKSFENNSWINPEKYEMVHFSKAVLENRKDRQLFGKSYVPELFAACGYIYIGSNTTSPSKVLKDLVKAAGGCITENSDKAKICIGHGGLKETWIIDCITSGELQSFKNYQQP